MRLLITSALRATPEQLSEIRGLGHEVTLVPDESAPLPPEAGLADGVICNGLLMRHDLAELPRLRYVQLTSAGLDRVPVDGLRAQGVALFSAAAVYSVPLAEWVMLQVLQLSKHSRHFLRSQEAREWHKDRDLRELDGRTMCIVGFGSVGREVSTRAKAFGMRVVAVRRDADEATPVDRVVALSRVADAVAEADVVVLTVPLTDDTRHLIDGDVLRSMKPDAFLVNVSRGEVVDESALVDALGEGRLGGVALDVFEREPLDPASPLWRHERVLVTPHNAYASDRVAGRMHDLVMHNLRTFSSDDETET